MKLFPYAALGIPVAATLILATRTEVHTTRANWFLFAVQRIGGITATERATDCLLKTSLSGSREVT